MAEIKNYADPPEPMEVYDDEPEEPRRQSRFNRGHKRRDKSVEDGESPSMPSSDLADTVAFEPVQDVDDSGVQIRLAASQQAYGKGAAFVIGWLLAGMTMGLLGFLTAFLTMKGTPWLRKAMVSVAIGVGLFAMLMALFYLLVLPGLVESWVAVLQQPVVYDGQ